MNQEPPLISAPPGYAPLHDTADHRPWYATPRARLFGVVFTVTLISGLILTLLQPTVYRSSATVLMTAAMAIDDEAGEANVQQVAIQRRILLGGEVTRQLLDALHDAGYLNPDAAYLREVLQVAPIPETNLVVMAAQGAESELLPVIVNAWIDMYLDIRVAHVEQSQQQTLQVVEDQLQGLDTKLERARKALADYREEHKISSAERQENEELSRLDGLNKALNKAVEKEIAAEAFVDTLRKAIADGKQVVPQSERRNVEVMNRELSQLNSQIKNLRKTYTLDFIRRNPKWRNIPVRIAELEQELAQMLEAGKYEALDLTEQSWETAKQSVIDLQERLEVQQEKAAHFTTVYATHEALVEDLAELESLNRETQSRLVQVEVNQVEKYPQVSVIDRPAGESLRIGPDYRLWLGGTALASLGLGVLAVWLYGFLGPREKPSFVTLSGVHMYPQDVNALSHDQQAQARLAQASAPLLQDNTAGTDVSGPEANSDEEKT